MNEAKHQSIKCQLCKKPEPYCVCSYIKPVENSVFVLILQHPREGEKLLASAHIAQLCLKNCAISVGLAWPNLRSALVKGKVDAASLANKKWGVLYLGTKQGSAINNFKKDQFLLALDSKAKPLEQQHKALSELGGIVVLDASWRQSKAMWWRNPWLLKLQRLSLKPKNTSLYGNLRRAPRSENLSTIEAIALSLSVLENDLTLQERLLSPFKAFLKLISS